MRGPAAVFFAGALFAGAGAADTVELVTGEKIEGEIVEQDEAHTVIEHPVLGRLDIPAEQIATDEKKHPGLFGTSFLEGFARSVSAGWSLSTGKSQTQTFNADAGLKRETERHRMEFRSSYFYDESDGEVEDNNFNARYTHDFLIPDAKWFPFLSPHYTFDSQQDWNHRVGADAGLGYQFLQTKEWDLLGRLGGGVSRTLKDDREETTDVPAGAEPAFRGDYPLRTEWTGLVLARGTWSYMDGQSLSAGASYQPDFADLPNFRAIGNAEWKVAVGAIEGLSVKTGVSYIHDSHETNRDRNDRKYYLNLAYDF
jgi:hypothetical protein